MTGIGSRTNPYRIAAPVRVFLWSRTNLIAGPKQTMSGKFEKGQSGNPSGRPRADVRVKELARAHTEQAIQTLVDALQNERTCVAAATALLDRGWGKPAQAITGEDGGAILTESRVSYDLSSLSDAELLQLSTLAEKVNAGPTAH